MVKTITPEDKAEAVAHYMVGRAQDNDVQYHTDNQLLAELTATNITRMNLDFDVDHIRGFAEVMKGGYAFSTPPVELWTFYICMTKYLSEGWNIEEEKDLSDAWAWAFNDLKQFSVDNLDGKDLKFFTKRAE